MANFTIRAVNSKFQTATIVGTPALADALDVGIRGAVAIATEEIAQGAKTASVDVSVDDAEGRPVQRVAVTLSVAPLFVG